MYIKLTEPYEPIVIENDSGTLRITIVCTDDLGVNGDFAEINTVGEDGYTETQYTFSRKQDQE